MEILLEKITEKHSVENSPKARLEKFLRENRVKNFTAKDFNFPKNEKTQAKIHAEVDDFLRMREEWREEDERLSAEREKPWR